MTVLARANPREEERASRPPVAVGVRGDATDDLVPRSEREPRDPHVDRRRQKVVGVALERPADARRGHRRCRDRHPIGPGARDLAPADPAPVIGVPEQGRSGPGNGCAEGRLQPQHVEPCLPREEHHPALLEEERRPLAVDLERETLTDRLGTAGRPRRALVRLGGPVAVGVDLGAFLERGDLGEVQDVPHLQHLRANQDAAVRVDREVAERMRRCGPGRPGQDGGGRHGDDGQHPTDGRRGGPGTRSNPRRAFGACTGEKCGLMVSASSRKSRAWSVRPRRNAIIPAWKWNKALWVPRPSASRVSCAAARWRPSSDRAQAKASAAATLGRLRYAALARSSAPSRPWSAKNSAISRSVSTSALRASRSMARTSAVDSVAPVWSPAATWTSVSSMTVSGAG